MTDSSFTGLSGNSLAVDILPSIKFKDELQILCLQRVFLLILNSLEFTPKDMLEPGWRG